MSEPTDTCDVYEYDGAFRCDRHKRLWGAVTDPAEPCAEVESKPGGGWHRGCRTIVGVERAREREPRPEGDDLVEPCDNDSCSGIAVRFGNDYRLCEACYERINPHGQHRPDPDTLLRELVRDVAYQVADDLDSLPEVEPIVDAITDDLLDGTDPDSALARVRERMR